MNRLSSILPAAQVLVSVDATSKKRAFEEAGLLFENLHGLSRALITDSLFARERLGSTGLGHGVAIPHGRIKGLKAPMAAVFRLGTPIGFDAPDEQPVGLLRAHQGQHRRGRTAQHDCHLAVGPDHRLSVAPTRFAALHPGRGRRLTPA
jgi:mannitol/fructose-specific phosphotransferase system IIA component